MRRPTKIVGTAAGNWIFQNCCERVRLKLRPTLSSVGRIADRPSIVLSTVGARPDASPIITIVMALRPKITRKSG